VGDQPTSANPPTVKTSYMVTTMSPDGVEHAIVGTPDDPSTYTAVIPGGYEGSDLSFVPGENGQWVFSVWRLDGGNRTLAVQRQAETDMAQVGAAAPGIGTGPRLRISGLRIQPSPVVGQQSTFTVQLSPDSGAQTTGEAPVSLVGDDGYVHSIGAVQFANGSGTFVWTPQQTASNSRLAIGTSDGLFPITVDPAVGPPASAAGEDAPEVAPSDADAPPTTGSGSDADLPSSDDSSASP
jgi:hypothetical protein